MTFKLFVADFEIKTKTVLKISCPHCGSSFKYAIGKYCPRCLRDGVEIPLIIERVLK
jgi:hypothetical protein